MNIDYDNRSYFTELKLIGYTEGERKLLLKWYAQIIKHLQSFDLIKDGKE